MKQNLLTCTHIEKGMRRKIALIMKWSFFFLFACAIQVSAKVHSQTKLTLRLQKATFNKLFLEIEKKTGYRFLFDDGLLPKGKTVDVNVKDEEVKTLLDVALSGTGLTYRISNDDLIVISASTGEDGKEDDYKATEITGRITDSSGQPISGASIVERGTKNGTSSGLDGTFKLQVSGPEAVIIVSSVGFTQRAITVGNQTNIAVSLLGETREVEQVVVIGYQTVRRRDLTGATAVVNTTNSNKIIGNSVVEQLQGQIPGVTVRTSGAPGSNAAIEIRGVASFSNNSPLYVIDGMISDANSTINTDDIETIQILKDASAAAIYGSRAASGVIIITTRKGRSGPAKVFFSAKAGAQQLPRRFNLMDATQYKATVAAQYAASNLPVPAGIASSPFNTNWQDVVYKTGSDQDYNVGISGGSAAGNFLISGSYYKNEGVVIGNNFNRASLRINTSAKKGIVTIGENMVLSNTVGKNPGGGINAFYEASQSLPVIGVQNDIYKTVPNNPYGYGFGSTNIPSYATNYVANVALDRQTYNFAKLVGNAYLDLNFTKWLSYRFNAGLETSFDFTKEVRDTGIWRYANQVPGTSVGENRSQFTNLLLEHTLNFNKTLGDHSISGVVGYTYQQYRTDNTSGGRLNLLSANGQQYTTISSALGSPSASSNTDLHRIQGYLGRVNYAYSDRYLLSLTGRIDQDSRFGINYRQGTFYSIAGGWRISKEKFFDISWVSDLKLRGSYGKLGISSAFDNGLGSWPSLGFINSNPRAIYGISQSPSVGAYQAQITNPDLHWEDRYTTNLGLDAALFHNRITLTVEAYNSLSKGVIYAVPLPGYLGSSGGNPPANLGSIRNKGIEFNIGYNHNNSRIKWDVSVNGSANQNRIVTVGNQAAGKGYLDAGLTRSAIGQSVGTWFLLQTAGIFQSQADVNSYKNKAGTVIQPLAKPGDIRYVDVNGDGQINNDDRTYVGGAFPKFQGGAQFNASYKSFSLNIQLVGVFGNKIYNGIRRNLDSYQLTNFRSDINPWSATNTNTNEPRLGIETGDPGIASNNIGNTNRWLENGSYVRLRNVELGYGIGKSILGKIGFTGARIFVSGQNLLTVTSYKGLDPDAVGNGLLERGYDNGNWPSSRRFGAGIQAEF